eukprot:jgi/Psemu1/61510/gm1.61510_g
MAINLVANELIPPYVFSDTASDASDDNGDGDADADAEDATAPAIYRRAELDDEFGTDISTRMVRDVAPGKVVVCSKKKVRKETPANSNNTNTCLSSTARNQQKFNFNTFFLSS